MINKSFPFSHRAQTVTETAILVTVIVFALIAMQTYLKRGMQGRLRDNIDSLGGQYDPQRTTSETLSNYETSSTSYSNTYRQRVSSGLGLGAWEDRSITVSTTVIDYENAFTNGFEIVDQP